MSEKEALREDYMNELETNIKQLDIGLINLKKTIDEGFKKLVSRVCHTIEGDSLFMQEYEIAYLATKLSHSVKLNEIDYAGDFLKRIKDKFISLKGGSKKKNTSNEISKVVKRLKDVESEKIYIF